MAELQRPTGTWLHACGALFLATGATAGAFGAHALREVFSPDRLEAWSTASGYLLVMGAGLLGAAGWTATKASRRALGAVASGTVLFSGSIMALVTLATFDALPSLRAVMGPITPLGGVLMIGGWLVWAMLLMRERQTRF